MIFTKQKYSWDCLIACICSLLEIDIETVPIKEKPLNADDFWKVILQWIGALGYGMIWEEDPERYSKLYPNAVFIGSGPSDMKDDEWHSVLYKNGEIIFNPAPRDYGVTYIDTLDVIVPLFVEK